jgi:hypothetical protein
MFAELGDKGRFIMKVFVWQQIGNATENYHPQGGLVVFAETEERARTLANAVGGCALKPEEMPEEVRDVSGGEERVFIMPDAGCC